MANKSPAAARAWQERKRFQNGLDETHQWFQREWRRSCLKTRQTEGCLTAKNRKEVENLGLKF